MHNVSIKSGYCYALLAFEVAHSIDLVRAEGLLAQGTKRASLVPKHKAPKYFGYSTAPLSVSLDTTPIRLGKFTTEPLVEILIYDFGAISLKYRIWLSQEIEALPELSAALYENDELLTHARSRVEELMGALSPALTKAFLADLVEDYNIFEIKELNPPIPPREFLANYSSLVAGVLRGEVRELSLQEEADALREVLSYTEADALLLDWHAAFLMNYDGTDVQAVLEFANVELLERRFLDAQLDRALDESYHLLYPPKGNGFGGIQKIERDLFKTGQLQVDAATLFEGLANALKIFGDQYLARVHGLVGERLSLQEWDTSISRKLETLESVYEKVSDRVSHKRMEAMEMAVIILFVVSIAISLIPGYKH
jgi:hypothetical protein